MNIHQDVFEFEFMVNSDATSGTPEILRIIGSFTASRLQDGTWTWVSSYLALNGRLALNSGVLGSWNTEIRVKVDEMIEERLAKLL